MKKKELPTASKHATLEVKRQKKKRDLTKEKQKKQTNKQKTKTGKQRRTVTREEATKSFSFSYIEKSKKTCQRKEKNNRKRKNKTKRLRGARRDASQAGNEGAETEAARKKKQ